MDLVSEINVYIKYIVIEYYNIYFMIHPYDVSRDRILL